MFWFALACGEPSGGPDPTVCDRVSESTRTLLPGPVADDAVTLPMDSEPYTVRLAQGAMSYLAIEVIEVDTNATLYLGAADVASSLWQGDTEVGLPEPVESPCPDDIPDQRELVLPTVGLWTLVLAESELEEVWVLLQP